MSAVALALMSAVAFGTGDFLGGVATRRHGAAVPVVVVSQLAGLATVIVLVPFFSVEIAAAPIGWGAAAGVVGGIGLVLLFRGFSLGKMSVVAPITAVGAAVIPLAYGLSIGERPSGLAFSGAVAGLVAIWLVSGATGDTGSSGRSGVIEGVGAGVGFGLFFILIRNTDMASGMIPLVAARSASIVVIGATAVGLGTRLAIRREALTVTLASGALDMLANAAFLLAVRTGLLTLVAVLASLYPAITLVLAVIAYRERIGRSQAMGLGLALAGTAAIAAG